MIHVIVVFSSKADYIKIAKAAKSSNSREYKKTNPAPTETYVTTRTTTQSANTNRYSRQPAKKLHRKTVTTELSKPGKETELSNIP